MGITCLGVRAITRMTNQQNAQTMFTYPQKILMWLAISNRGMSIPYFRPSKSVAINTEIFINECLQPRLLPFIHKHHGDFNYLFWPDLARAHYSKESVAWMNENVYFVDENTNPPNVPQARPIENLGVFWHRKFMREDGRLKRSRS